MKHNPTSNMAEGTTGAGASPPLSGAADNLQKKAGGGRMPTSEHDAAWEEATKLKKQIEELREQEIRELKAQVRQLKRRLDDTINHCDDDSQYYRPPNA